MTNAKHARRRVLFLCIGNCVRSQMAEGLLRAMAGDRFESLSAGVRPAGYVHPLTIEVMKELGIDLLEARSKDITEFLPERRGVPPDLLISVCDTAAAYCPTFPASIDRLHWPVCDPILAEGSGEERCNVFRRVRDELRARLEKALASGELERSRKR